MGFGLLLIGYVISFILSYNPYMHLTQLLGFSVMLAAMRKLAPYSRRFSFAMAPAVALIAASAYRAAIFFLPKAGVNLPDLSKTETPLSIAVILLYFILHYFMLFGIRGVAADTGIGKIRINSMRNFILGAVSCVLMLIVLIPLPVQNDFITYFGLSIKLTELVWYILNAGLIFSAYRRICLEGEEEIPQKPSRFGFINKFRAEQERLEQNNFNEGKRLAEELQNKRRNKKKKRKHR